MVQLGRAHLCRDEVGSLGKATMTKIVVAIMLALSALGPANADSTTLPSQFLGQWCATYNESDQPGRVTYSRDLKDCDRVLTIRSRGFADTDVSCDLITVR